MKYKIYKILFVFAIFFGNIATPAAMTLEEYWNSTNVWNIWVKEEHAHLDNYIYNVRCKTSTDNPCCAYLDEKFIGTEQKVYVIAYYPNDTQEEDIVSLTPTMCEYTSNACFSCNLQLDTNNKITGDCLKNSYTDIIHDLTCPTDYQSYAKCEERTDENKEYQVNNTQILIHIMECRCSNDNEEPDDNNMCPTYTAGDGKCAPGYYGTTDCKKCPTGSYCPAGASAPTTCPTAWPNSNAGSTQIENCYADLGDNTGNTIKYIDCPNGTNSPSTCEQQETTSITDDTTSSLRGHQYPGGKLNCPNTGKNECTYQGNEDTGENILNWLRDRCPLAKDASAVTGVTARKTYKIGHICYADIITDTPCGQIVTEAVPQATNGKYLTWDNGSEVRPTAGFYNSLSKGLYATILLTPTYCSDKNHGEATRRLYKKANICLKGKYCEGYTYDRTPLCKDVNYANFDESPYGNVAAGYYSTGGAYQEKPTKPGQGCLSGYNCGQCPAGSTSPAGAASCSTCSDGTYSNASGATTCTNCEKGYYCTDGNRYKCPAGSTSEAGQSAITDCYIKGDEGGTNFCVKNNCFNIQSDVKAYYSGNTSQ